MNKFLALAPFLFILLLINCLPACADVVSCGCYCGKVISPPCSDDDCKRACGWQEPASSSGGQSSYDYEAERQRQEEAERQRQAEAAAEARRQKREEEARQRQIEFEQKKEDALRSMKGISEGELGLKDAVADSSFELTGAGGTKSDDLGLKTLFDKGSPGSAPVDTRAKGPSTLDVGRKIDLSTVQVQDGVPDAAQLKKDLLENFTGAIIERTLQPNAQAAQIMRSFKMNEPPNPVKNIAQLAAGDVILVAPVPLRENLKDEDWHHMKDVMISNGIHLLDRWGSANWSSPASHTAIFLGERNGKRWYMDNTAAGPVIMEESAFLDAYGARKMDVATLVGQPLSPHEGEELWKGAHELRNTVKYGPSNLFNWGRDDAMVCSEAARWELLRAGRRVPETNSDNGKIFGIDIGLNKKQFVSFSPSDFYANQQYFVVHQLSTENEKKP